MIIDNIRTAFEKFGAKRNPQLDNTAGLLEPGEGYPSSNRHGLQLAPLPVTKFIQWHLCVPHLTQASFLPKNQMLQNMFFDIFHVEMAQRHQKS